MGNPEQVPLQIALLIDVSGSTHTRFDFEKLAAARFLKEVLKKDDRASLFVIDRTPVLKQVSTTAEVAASALLTVLERPGVFGRLLLESPSLYVGGRLLLRKARRAPRWPARVYLGVGTQETSKADVNRETVENVRALESNLHGAGLGPKRLKVVVKEGATHSEGAWADRLPEALSFLFG